MQRRLNNFANGLYLTVLCCVLSPFAHAQGVLTISPGRTVSSVAGSGNVGYSGNGGAATSAALASPSAVAYDSAGNLYIADTANHVVRKVDTSGVIASVAGSGEQGFSGDGGAATSAALDSPTGVAVDASGNLYIADSHNHRIRKVSGGTISTVAGTGTAGFSGDGSAATQAELFQPSGVAVDASGNLYIADTNNHRIRKVTSSGVISTIAGNGEELYAGDGGLATAAALDLPTSVAVDSAGRLYIADRQNHVIRMVDSAGRISTIAGSGGFGFSGDAGSATSASLAKPGGVAVDSTGNVYIADTNNHRIRQVANGVITTVAGTGEEIFAGDNGAATGAGLMAPQNAAVAPSGALAVADRGNERIRSINPGGLSFAQPVGSRSAGQVVTLRNTGSASLQVQTATLSEAFGILGGTCGSTPVTLPAGASCTEEIFFVPAIAGSWNGSVTFSGAGLVPQSLFLNGTAVPAGTSTTLSASSTNAYQGVAVSFTANVAAATSGIPTGTVGVYDGDTLLSTVALGTGKATYTTSSLAVGTHTITARYSGDANYLASTTTASAITIAAAPGFTIEPSLGGGTGGSGTGGSGAGGSGTGGSGSAGATQTVPPGQPATYGFTIQAQNAPLTTPVVFSALGLPAGATAIFSPPSIIPGLTASTFTMTIQTPRPTQTSRVRVSGVLAASFLFSMVLMPLAGSEERRRRSAKLLRRVGVCLLLGAIGGAVLLMSSCGAANGFLGQAPQQYTITVVGTTTGVDGVMMQRLATVNLIVQ